MAAAPRKSLGVSMPMLNQPCEKFPEFARLADEAGFDSLWDYEFYRNPFITHARCAATTSRIRLCTGIAAACSRSPNEMANAAADVDELSGGRMVLGLSTGGAHWAEFYNGSDVDHPLPRIREYVDVVRKIWHHHATGEAFEHAGRFYRASSPPMNPWGLRTLARARIPIYVAGLREGMVRMAGEVADGLLGFVNTPEYLRDKVLPVVAEGARRANRDPAEVDVTALVLCSVSDDRQAAMRRARINVGMYVAYPVADAAVQHMGLAADRDAVVKALMAEGPACLERVTSDALVRAFSIAGTPAEGREQLAAYQAVLPHVVLHTPYVPPIGQADSEDAFRSMVRTFAR